MLVRFKIVVRHYRMNRNICPRCCWLHFLEMLYLRITPKLFNHGGGIQHCPLTFKQHACLYPCQQQQELPNGLLSNHWLGLILLNFSFQIRLVYSTWQGHRSEPIYHSTPVRAWSKSKIEVYGLRWMYLKLDKIILDLKGSH